MTARHPVATRDWEKRRNGIGIIRARAHSLRDDASTRSSERSSDTVSASGSALAGAALASSDAIAPFSPSSVFCISAVYARTGHQLCTSPRKPLTLHYKSVC